MDKYEYEYELEHGNDRWDICSVCGKPIDECEITEAKRWIQEGRVSEARQWFRHNFKIAMQQLQTENGDYQI